MKENIEFDYKNASVEKVKAVVIPEKDIKEIKKLIQIQNEPRGVFVYLVAYYKCLDLNPILELSTKSGIPLNPEVHNVVSDNYVFRGVSIFNVGYIPVSYRLVLGDSCFEEFVPLPFSVVKRYMSNDNKKKLAKWKLKFNDTDFAFKTFQILETT